MTTARAVLRRTLEGKTAPGGRALPVVDEADNTAAVPEIPSVAQPAPGATPEGALAFFTGSDGAEAWLARDGEEPPAGYLRDTAQPDRALLIPDAAAWAAIVDDLKLTEQPVPNATAIEAATASDAVPPEVKAAAVVDAKDAEGHTGIMVAFVVPEGDAADIALNPAEVQSAAPPQELHLTLAYLGTTDEVDDEGEYYTRVLEALREVAAEHKPISGEVSGVGRFSIDSDRDAFYYSFDSPALPALRQDIVEALDEAGIKVAMDHGFTPHITIAYLAAGEENPLRRADRKVLQFDDLIFSYAENRVAVRLGGNDPTEETVLNGAMTTRPDSTAPSAQPAVKSGAFVSWDGGQGRVDLVVTSGAIPGVKDAAEGSTETPVARVVCYTKGADGWAETEAKAAVAVAELTPIAPLETEVRETGAAALVRLLAEYHDAVPAGVPAVSPVAVKAVFDRGTATWPGEDVCGVDRERWALGRTKAFLHVAAGGDVPGYVADRDLLPVDHPAVEAPAADMVSDEDTNSPDDETATDDTGAGDESPAPEVTETATEDAPDGFEPVATEPAPEVGTPHAAPAADVAPAGDAAAVVSVKDVQALLASLREG